MEEEGSERLNNAAARGMHSSSLGCALGSRPCQLTAYRDVSFKAVTCLKSQIENWRYHRISSALESRKAERLGVIGFSKGV